MMTVTRTQSSAMHVLLLLAYAGAMIVVWNLPTIAMGYPIYFPVLGGVNAYLTQGTIPVGDGRIAVLLLAPFTRFVAMTDVVGWTFVASAAFASALLPFWWSVQRLFDRRTAWVATVLLSFMPVYWMQAVKLDNYAFSFLFLFSGFAVFIALFRRSLFAAFIGAGLAFGFAVACKDAFVTFLPWIILFGVAATLPHWQKGIVGVTIFSACAFFAFTIPLIPSTFSLNAPWGERLVRLLPLERAKPSPEEFYGDTYTAQFDREWFNAETLKRRTEAGFIENIGSEGRLISFGIGDGGVLSVIRSGGWLFLNHLPPFFFQETVGGVFLWLFILPGAFLIFRKRRVLFVFLAGLLLGTELLIRFVLQFQRIHLMDDGWILALFAAVGMVWIADALESLPRFSAKKISFTIVLLTVLNLAQVNRIFLSRIYARSTVPATLFLARDLRSLPKGSIVAFPTVSVAGDILKDQRLFLLRTDTVERLIQRGTLREIIAHYGITHILGYPADLEQQIVRNVPFITVLPPARETPTPITPTMSYLLHLFR